MTSFDVRGLSVLYIRTKMVPVGQSSVLHEPLLPLGLTHSATMPGPFVLRVLICFSYWSTKAPEASDLSSTTMQLSYFEMKEEHYHAGCPWFWVYHIGYMCTHRVVQIIWKCIPLALNIQVWFKGKRSRHAELCVKISNKKLLQQPNVHKSINQKAENRGKKHQWLIEVLNHLLK